MGEEKAGETEGAETAETAGDGGVGGLEVTKGEVINEARIVGLEIYVPRSLSTQTVPKYFTGVSDDENVSIPSSPIFLP